MSIETPQAPAAQTGSQTSAQPTGSQSTASQSRRSRSGRSGRAGTQSVTHVTPRPLLEPIREVKRHSIHWKRKVFHVLGIGAAGFTYALAPVTKPTALMILGGIAAVFVFLDVLRFKVPALNKKVKRDFGPFMRDYELDGISGSSWFFFSALITIAACFQPAAGLGMVFLALGDPIASAVGVKWGRIKLPNGKSLEGSLAFLAVCFVAGLPILLFKYQFALLPALAVTLVTALVAAAAEAIPSKKVDDNFTVPLAGGLAASGMMLALGLV
jgi:dolichol kinase